MSDDFITRLERQLEAAELREFKRAPALRRIANPRRLLSVPLAAAAAVGVVVVVLAVLGAIDTNDADRLPQPVRTVPAPRVEVVVADVERGISLGLDGRVLTVVLLADKFNETYETVSRARISATCGTNVGETTLTQDWPSGWASTRYRFPRDVSRWCRLEDQSGSIVAFGTFPGVPPGARELITETANNWARAFASSAEACNDYTSQSLCEQAKCTGRGEGDQGLQADDAAVGREHRGATVARIAISGDRAAATFADPPGDTLQLRRTATGEWLIDKLGPIGAVGSDQ